ncbi:MAG: 16S rRNA (adenine(1518)-N(6)/adenine(1519)-N(6))-dimethyltransferase RsmA [Gemmataceae bacterium]|nr:16S rRNA (adenine(1518)-N(6)/adenine(1519)-N(6))-dimethyltransferase RsmA [Gemmataceae bacterium]
MESHAPPRRQTQSFLRDLILAQGLKPKNKLGQNFLVDLNLIDFIVRHADLTKHDLALEVGTGTGSLTAKLADGAGAVLSVEIDAAFHQLAQQTLGPRPNVILFHGDILKNKNHLNPDVLAQLDALRQEFKCQRVKLIANLPYAVATPVIGNLILLDLPIERMVVTVQWEIAAKLRARPGTEHFGGLSVLVQSLADVEIRRRLPPAVFWPRPQVDSAIVRIWPRPAKRARIAHVQAFRDFLRDLYAHRRKNLRGGLASMAHGGDKRAIDAKLAELGMDGGARAETLSLEDHRRLWEAFAGEGLVK